MGVRQRFAFVVAVVLCLAAACSSSTVIDADTDRASNDDRAGAPAEDQALSDDEPETAATPIPPTPAPAEEDAAPPRSLSPQEREAQWEGLANLCRADDPRACDVLFLISEVNSDYESLASTCNGAGPPATGWCTAGITTGLNGLSFDESSPGINAVATDCSNGDMMACDFLYFASPGGGEWEDFGDGCGGITTSAFPDCRSEFPE